jgi:ER-bound oxygenase mpaB/B'/Rubber oxygenase, catalytic domain
MSTEQAPEVRAWPAQRSRRSTVAAQFGTDRADLMAWALTTADPLADAVVAEIQERGRAVRIDLATGIEHGLASLADPPPAVAALLTQAESLPDYVDDALLDEGPLPQYSMPNPVHAISLSAGALVRVYQSPSIATVLATTGRLIDGARRRIDETGKWVRTATLPGAMRLGAPGYVQTLQVRMLHAQMRRLARTRGYDEAALGAPINQVDLARTWMDFTVTSYRAEALMGFDLSSSEQSSLYRYWWYVGHVLGIDARLIEGIAGNDEAKRVDDLLETVTGPLIPESGVLAKATIEAVIDVLHEVLSIPPRMGLPAMYALTRRFHGNSLCDELGLPSAGPADGVLSAAIRVVQARRAKLRQDPDAWRRDQLKNVAEARAIDTDPSEPTGYQQEAAVES